MIIGLVGLKQSGKSTALEVIQNIAPAQELQLAKHLKDVCAMVFNIYRPDLDDQRFKELDFGSLPSDATQEEISARGNYRQNPVILHVGHLNKILEMFEIPRNRENMGLVEKHVGVEIKTPRYAAQYVGTEIARAIDPDIHIKMTIKNADPKLIGVVSDIRFPNEFTAFSKAESFLSLFIRREATIPADLASQHESERHVLGIGDKCDYRVTNDATREEFMENVRSIVTARLEKTKAA